MCRKLTATDSDSECVVPCHIRAEKRQSHWHAGSDSEDPVGTGLASPETSLTVGPQGPHAGSVGDAETDNAESGEAELGGVRSISLFTCTEASEPAPEPASGSGKDDVDKPFHQSVEMDSGREVTEATTHSTHTQMEHKEAQMETLETVPKLQNLGPDGPDEGLSKLLEHLMQPNEATHSEDQVPDCIFWQKSRRPRRNSVSKMPILL